MLCCAVLHFATGTGKHKSFANYYYNFKYLDNMKLLVALNLATQEWTPAQKH